MLFIVFIADNMGVSESLEGRYLQNLCQVVKSCVCPQKDRSTGAVNVSEEKCLTDLIFVAGGWSLLRLALYRVFTHLALSMQPDASFVVLRGTICVVLMHCWIL